MARLLPVLLLLAGCGAAAPPPPPRPEPPVKKELEPAPWSARPVALGAVPQAYLSEWQRAKNKYGCPLLVLTDLGVAAGAWTRPSGFGDGWGVTYDKPGLPGVDEESKPCADCGRSVMGIAATDPSSTTTPAAEKVLSWSDGSSTGYRKGAVGFGAYVSPKGIDCLYHVYSAVGEDHLLVLVRGLRRVEGM